MPSTSNDLQPCRRISGHHHFDVRQGTKRVVIALDQQQRRIQIPDIALDAPIGRVESKPQPLPELERACFMLVASRDFAPERSIQIKAS